MGLNLSVPLDGVKVNSLKYNFSSTALKSTLIYSNPLASFSLSLIKFSRNMGFSKSFKELLAFPPKESLVQLEL